MPKRFKPVVNDTTVYVQGRISYANLFEPRAPKGLEEKYYSCVVLIDPEDKESLAAIDKAVEAAVKKGIASKWEGKRPRRLQTPLQDGDERESSDFHGWKFFNCKARLAPAVLDRKKAPILDREQVYSGMWGIVCVNMYPYTAAGNNGVAAGLNAVLKTADDTRLGGSGSGERAFDNIEIDPLDDDDEVPDMV